MASVSKRGDAWRVVWRDRQGSQKQKTFDRKRDADAFKAQVEVDMRSGAYVDPRLARMTVGAQWTAWSANRRASAGRMSLEASLWRKRLAPRWQDVKLEDVDVDSVQAWINDLAEELSPASVRSCLQLLSAMLESAVRGRKIVGNAARHVTLQRAPRHLLTHDDVLDGHEVAAVAKAVVPERWQVFVFASGWLGWRLGEGLGIRRCDVNLLHNTVTVGRYVVEEVDGRSRLRQGSKTQASTGRVVPLPPSVAKALASHIEHFVTDPHPEALIFLLDNGCHPSRSNLLRQVLRPALARAGVDSGATLRKHGDRWLVAWYDEQGRHQQETFATQREADAQMALVGSRRDVDFRQLRHTAASLMLAAGVEPVDVARRLGHSRPSITLDIYTHLLKRTETAGTERIEQAIQDAEAGPAATPQEPEEGPRRLREAE